MKADITKTSNGSLNYLKEDVEINTIEDLKRIYDEHKYPLIITFGTEGMDIEIYDDYRE